MKYGIASFLSIFVLALIVGFIGLYAGELSVAVLAIMVAWVVSIAGAAIFFYWLGQANLVTGGDLVMRATRDNDAADAAKLREIANVIKATTSAITKQQSNIQVEPPEDKFLLPPPDQMKYTPFEIVEQGE